MRTKQEILNGMNEELFAEQCRVSPAFFIERVLGFIIEPVHREWLDLIQTNKRVCIMAPTGSGKSQILGIGYGLWLIYHGEGVQILVVSNEKEQASKLLERFVNEIDGNEMLKKLRPEDSRLSWTKTEFNTPNKCKVFCKSYTPNIRSYHVDFALCDEIAQYRDHDIFFRFVMTRVTAKKGRIVCFSTAISMLDLPHKLCKNPEFVGRKYMAIKDSQLLAKDQLYSSPLYDEMQEGEPLCPKLYSREELDKIKNSIGSIAFDREYQNNVSSIKDSLFPPDLVAEGFDETLDFQNAEGVGRCYIGADFAVSVGKDADYSVFVVIENNGVKNFIRRIERYRGMPVSAQIDRLIALHSIYKCDALYIDESNIGAAILQELRMKSMPVVGCPFNSSARNQYLLKLRKFFEDKQIVIPRKLDGNSIELTDILFTELTSFVPSQTPSGLVTYQSMSDHDDCSIALALSVSGVMGQYTQTKKVIYS